LLLKKTYHVEKNLSRGNKRSRDPQDLEDRMLGYGVTKEVVEHVMDRVRSRSRSQSRNRSRSQEGSDIRSGRKRERSESVVRNLKEIEIKKRKTSSKSPSRERSLSAGFKNLEDQDKAAKMLKKLHVKHGRFAKRGEGDRSIPTLRPKHLSSGKRGIGKTDWR